MLEAAEKLSQTIAKLGAKGKLDSILVDLKDDSLNQMAREINSSALAAPELQAKLEQAGGGAGSLLIALKDFVLSHPFVASCECYFGGPITG